jgi:hypothetical protein
MKKSAILTLCAVSAIAATAAWAGARGGMEVSIDLANRRAYGSLGNVRNSVDVSQYIGCSTNANNAGTQSANCYARNSANTFVSCQTSTPALVDIARSLNGDSLLQFYWDATGQCTYIYLENDSYYAPKNH